jgi:Uma2 family endonuclease
VTSVSKPMMTAQELEHMPRGDERRELVSGELIRMAPVGREHGAIAVRLAARLLEFVEPRGLGEVGVEVGYVLSRDPDTVRAPDVSFVAASRVPPGAPKGFVSGAPDLAIEIVSPDDTASQLDLKVQEYLTAGASLVWIVHPATRTITAYRPDGTARVFRSSDRLEGEDAISGFELPVQDVFRAA